VSKNGPYGFAPIAGESNPLENDGTQASADGFQRPSSFVDSDIIDYPDFTDGWLITEINRRKEIICVHKIVPHQAGPEFRRAGLPALKPALARPSATRAMSGSH